MKETIRIGERAVGAGHPVLIVAELSANHGGSLERAEAVIRAAARCGADAVKFQTYTPDTMTLPCDGEMFRAPQGSLWAGRTLYDLYAEAHTPWEWHARLFEVAREEGLIAFSTPFDGGAIELLEGLGAPAHKVASFELVDLDLIERIARTGKPVILSTGMGTAAEIDDAVRTVRAAGNDDLVVLRCTSAYPAPPDEMNLRALDTLRRTHDVLVGLSDHSPGHAAATAAVALGACVVEKHFCLARSDGGPDAAFSLEPAELEALVQSVRTVEQALGTGELERGTREGASLRFRRSLFAVADIAAGEPLTRDNVRAIRPSNGLAPKHLPRVLGCRARVAIARGTPIAWELLEAVPAMD